MVDQVQLLSEVRPLTVGDRGTQSALEKAIKAALDAALGALPLEAARGLSSEARRELQVYILDKADSKVWAAIAARWEPKRTLKAPDTELKNNLPHALVSLLNREREPYVYAKSKWSEVAALPGGQKTELRKLLTNLVPLTELKKIVKDWDPYLQPQPATRGAILERLSELLDVGSPVPKPPRPATKRAAKASSAQKAPVRSTE